MTIDNELESQAKLDKAFDMLMDAYKARVNSNDLPNGSRTTLTINLERLNDRELFNLSVAVDQ